MPYQVDRTLTQAAADRERNPCERMDKSGYILFGKDSLVEDTG